MATISRLGLGLVRLEVQPIKTLESHSKDTALGRESTNSQYHKQIKPTFLAYTIDTISHTTGTYKVPLGPGAWGSGARTICNCKRGPHLEEAN